MSASSRMTSWNDERSKSVCAGCISGHTHLKTLGEECASLSELLDLLANDVDTTVVRGVELGKRDETRQLDTTERTYLKDLLAVLGPIYPARNCQYGRCLPRTRWSVE